MPSFEEVKATNSTVSSVFNSKTGEIVALALIKGFRFKIALMEEHFNENYAESHKFPKATFVGRIKDFDINKITEKSKSFEINGKIRFHGMEVEIKSFAKISKIGNAIKITTSFILNPDNFNINISSVIRKKVAETVNVTDNLDLKEKK